MTTEAEFKALATTLQSKFKNMAVLQGANQGDDIEIISAKRPLSKKRNELLQIIINARKYMQSKGSSKKMILELIAIHL